MVAAVNLNIFHAHADRVRMTNIAQMINVLQAMILTDKEKMLLTPTYHVFHMYKPFRGATQLPVELEAPQHKLGETSAPTLTASAARGMRRPAARRAGESRSARGHRPATSRSPGAIAEETRRHHPDGRRHGRAQHLRRTRDREARRVQWRARLSRALVRVEVPAKSIIVLSETGKMNYAFRMKLKPGNVDEYKRRHDEIWPELAQLLREAGIYDYSIFLDEEDLHLFAVLKLARRQQARVAAQTSGHAALVGVHAGPDVHPPGRPAQ